MIRELAPVVLIVMMSTVGLCAESNPSACRYDLPGQDRLNLIDSLGSDYREPHNKRSEGAIG
jgi:hypothetical protein